MSVGEVDAVIEPLVAAYQRSYASITRQLSEAAQGSRRAVRLHEIRTSIERELTYLNREVTPRVAQAVHWANDLGFGAGAAGAGVRTASWDLIDRGAAERLAKGLHDDLLRATSRVDQTSKTLLNKIGRGTALEKLLEGQTAVQAGRAMALQAKDLGVYAVIYSNGSRHGLDEYAAMAMRTVTANAYNEALVDGAVAENCQYFEIFDGPDCGLEFHDDGTIADGMVVDANTAKTFSISHPNCRRSFGPRPDVTSKGQAEAASRSTTQEQRADQIAADRARGLPVRPSAERAALEQSRGPVHRTSKATQPHRTSKAAKPVPNFRINDTTIPVHARADIEAAMLRIQARYPDLTKGVTVMGGTNPGSNGWVHRGATNQIYLNREIIKDPAKMSAQLHHQDRHGFKVNVPESVSGIQYTTTHEMGHIAHNRGMHLIDELQREVKQGGYVGRATTKTVFDPEALANYGSIEEGLSRYAATNRREWFAEAFTDHMLSPNPGPFGQAIGTVLEAG